MSFRAMSSTTLPSIGHPGPGRRRVGRWEPHAWPDHGLSEGTKEHHPRDGAAQRPTVRLRVIACVGTVLGRWAGCSIGSSPLVAAPRLPGQGGAGREIKQSTLAWVIVRPALLTNGRWTGVYQVGLDVHPQFDRAAHIPGRRCRLHAQTTDRRHLLRKAPALWLLTRCRRSVVRPRPMPDPPPVMKTALPVSFMCWLVSCGGLSSLRPNRNERSHPGIAQRKAAQISTPRTSGTRNCVSSNRACVAISPARYPVSKIAPRTAVRGIK